MIDAGLGREDHSSIPATAIGRGLKLLNAITDPRTSLGGPVGWILVVKKIINYFYKLSCKA
jgi:uncharacterized protein YaaW (UPF0174 family)